MSKSTIVLKKISVRLKKLTINKLKEKGKNEWTTDPFAWLSQMYGVPTQALIYQGPLAYLFDILQDWILKYT